ncbi:hypothetical protein H6P81_010079 [Aristolochia fimbriata]|uniref:Uncharacterized protein n=1 Tax=Aristolochia fimbriata TaxID=158543 RepID=A0AAV7ENZ7_ARIFI|nr:hypothetical protein H6P81_010079 [Aristolochia fimbriata]
MSLLHPLPSYPSSGLRRDSSLCNVCPDFIRNEGGRNWGRKRAAFIVGASDRPEESPKLVTFLGKGGSGKTTAAVLAAQYYAKAGLNTCIVLHSQDLTAEVLMGCTIGTSPTICCDNLSAVRLETSKMLLEPLDRLKRADKHLNLTQGVLQGVVGEELGVLPGMDSIFSVLEIEKLLGYIRGSYKQKNNPHKEFDVIVYDGISNEDTLRMMAVCRGARLYLKYLRNMAEKTDIGRLTAPSVIKLIDESLRRNGGSSDRSSTELWSAAEQALENASAAFSETSRFGCYLVMDLKSRISVNSALRYWGCVIQAGAQVSGAFGFKAQTCDVSEEAAKEIFSPLPFALVPYLPAECSVDWDATLKVLNKDAQDLFCGGNNNIQSVNFDRANKSVTLFMPGFNKTDIKLYQYRGGSELLVEAGDQRRVIRLPLGVQGKVGGAKFIDRKLIITLL